MITRQFDQTRIRICFEKCFSARSVKKEIDTRISDFNDMYHGKLNWMVVDVILASR